MASLAPYRSHVKTLTASQRVARDCSPLSVAASTTDLRLPALRCRKSFSIGRLQCRSGFKPFSRATNDCNNPSRGNASRNSLNCAEKTHPSQPSDPIPWPVRNRQALVAVASSATAAAANLSTLVSQVHASEGSPPPTLTSLLIETQRSVFTSLYFAAEQLSALADVKIDPSSALSSVQNSLSQSAQDAVSSLQSVPSAAAAAASALAATTSSSVSSFSLPLSSSASTPPSESLTTLLSSLSSLFHALSDLSLSLSSQPLFLPLASTSAALSLLLLALALYPSDDALPSSPYASISTTANSSDSSSLYSEGGSSTSSSAMLGGTNGPSGTSMMVVPVDTTGSLRSNRRAAAAAGGRKGLRRSYDGRELPLSYDPDAINAYLLRRPGVLLRRAVWAAGQTGGVVWQLVQDAMQGGVSPEVERERAKQVVALIARLGPTAIKVGQALSIRPDLLSPTYLLELQQLQDRVPPFPCSQAQAIIEAELGRPVGELFVDFPSAPVAAASLGQVYKARVRGTGEEVAVKVQRPAVRENIAIDLLLLRATAGLVQLLPGVATDLVAVLDSFSERFFRELDYGMEARNAMRFAQDMSSLKDVVVPRVLPTLSTNKILTTEWINGEKLSDCSSPDVDRLVSLALNTYLLQLLDTGFLHADPHPGNLLRTTEGKLCILDFGFMTEVTPVQRQALLDYISHLVTADYSRVAYDLVALGFVPQGLADARQVAGIVGPLSRVLTQLSKGGGAKFIDVQQVVDDVSSITQDIVLVIPPYFAVIMRAFGVLEGIALDRNPNYSIVRECLPYIANRLLSDDAPRTRAALRTFLYGSSDRLDIARLEQLVAASAAFASLSPAPLPPSITTDASQTDPLASPSSQHQQPLSAAYTTTVDPLPFTPSPLASPSLSDLLSDPAAAAVARSLLAPQGSYLQQLLLTELVRTVDAASRLSLARLWSLLATAASLPLPPALRQQNSFPVLLPGTILRAASGGGDVPVASLSAEDLETLGSARRLLDLLMSQQPGAAQAQAQQGQGGSLSNGRLTLFDVTSVSSGAVSAAAALTPTVLEYAPGMAAAVARFAVMLLQRQALRLADDLDGGRSVEQWERDPYSLARMLVPSPSPQPSPASPPSQGQTRGVQQQ